MKRNQNQFWTVASKVLAVMTVTLIMALALAPSAWAASRYKILYSFTGGADGSWPQFGQLILDTSGNLYGTTSGGGAFGDGVVFELIKNSDGTWTESVLYSFAGGSDGASPYAGLTFDASGNLYGTTEGGGASSAGTVFQLVPNSDGTWTESVLYSFTGGSDGANPWAGVIFDATGTLYGTTYLGGASGLGVVYKLTPNSGGTWTESVLHTFTGSNGIHPVWGNLAFDTAGNLYGTTGAGGGGTCSSWAGTGCGVIFELKPQSDGSWKEHVILSLSGQSSYANPLGVVFDSAGNLYSSAGSTGPPYGAVFKFTLDANGKWTGHVLYAFGGNEDGAYPSIIALDAAGGIFGTTSEGYGPDGACCGQVFKLTPHAHGWSRQAAHYFQGPPQDGTNTNAGVVLDAAGNIYGTTCNGGSGGGSEAGCVLNNGYSGAGVVYEFTP